MIVLLTVLCVVFGFSSLFFFIRAYTLAGNLAEQQEIDGVYILQLETTLKFVYDSVELAHNEMERIDTIGAFKSEDEVGTTFALLKQVIDDLEEQVNGPKEEKEE